MKWRRFVTKASQAYYQTSISDTSILQIWKDNKGWNWVVIGWLDDGGPLITKHGICKTMKAAIIQIETILPQPEEQVVMFGDT